MPDDTGPHITLEMLDEAARRVLEEPRPWHPPRPLLSKSRYERCRRGEHELLHGFCVHCWTTVPPSSP